MANALSYLMLVLALPLGIAMFLALRPATATIAVFLSFTMFLPEVVTIDFPGLPAIGKVEVTSLACLMGLMLRGRRKLREARIFRGPELLLALLLVGDFVTVRLNRDPLVYGPKVLPGLDFNEVVSVIFSDALWYLVPFFVGRALIVGVPELRMLLQAVALAGVVYMPLLFVELMMSPQLHNWIYGFHQHAFDQTMRGGGYRPMVFMTHGLAVGLLMCWAVLASLTLVKARRAILGMPAGVAALGNIGFLIACKSLGAALYAVTFGPIMVLASPRNVGRLAVLVGTLVLTYPACRAFDVVPTASLVNLARAASPDRAASLQYRFDMEDLFTAHVEQRKMFGWGRFGRSWVHDPYDGRVVSVADGHWIVAYGIHGIVGFSCMFLTLVWPLLTLRAHLRRIEAPKERVLLAGLAAIVMVGTVDLIPNGLFNPLVVLLAGALYGAARALSTSVVASPALAQAAEEP